MIIKSFLGYSKKYVGFLTLILSISWCVAGIATIFFSMLLNISDAILRGLELEPSWLIMRYPIFLIGTFLMVLFGALTGAIGLADWLWLDSLNKNFNLRTSMKRGVSVGFMIAIGMTYLGVVVEYPKYMTPTGGLILFPFVTLFSCFSGFLIGKLSFRWANLSLPECYNFTLVSEKDFSKIRFSTFRLNFFMFLITVVSVSVVISFLHFTKTINNDYLQPWNFLENWDYVLFLFLMLIAIFSYAGYFMVNRICILIVEKQINKRLALIWGFLIGGLFGVIVWLGLSYSFIGSIRWWMGQHLLLCVVVYGCLNGYSTMRAWEQLQSLE
jgi:hypothetical protein